jgi:type IV secretory pathway TraG/TraD family ATPase VirD4
MLQLLEIGILNAILFYFEVAYPWKLVIGLPCLLSGIGLLMIQFSSGRGTFIPGVIASILLCFEISHLVMYQPCIKYIDSLIDALSFENTVQHPFPSLLSWLLEPIFSIFVANVEYRYVYEEIAFVFLAGYCASVGYSSWLSYKQTGEIWGELGISEILKEDSARPQRSESNELGSGDLASVDRILQWTRPSKDDDCDTILPIKELRGSGGIVAVKVGNLHIPREQRNRHVLTIAKTGSGKTSRLILPVLLSDVMDPKRSTVVIDSKPEMWENLANFSRTYNPERNILRFSPLDKERSLSWNFLSKIEDDSDCKLIANTVIMATEAPGAKADSPFFKNNALSILNAIMVGLLLDEEETLSMPRIHELVQSGMKPLCDWLEKHPEAYRTSRTFVELARSGSQNADTIMSELGMRISAWDLHSIRATTAHTEIDPEDLVSKPTLFIVEFKESELEMLRPMANVIVIELLRFLTKRAETCAGHSLPRPVGFVIDEFASALGRLPDIHVKLNTLRSRNVSIVAAIQSMNQVKANYGEDADSVLAGFSTRIFMPALDVADAEWASKETGQMTIRFSTQSQGSNKKIVEWFASKNVSTQEQVQQRAVLTPDEIGRPEDNRATFFLPNTPPFQGHLVPFYERADLAKKFSDCKKMPSLTLRDAPIHYEDKPVAEPTPKDGAAAGGGGGNPAALPTGISDTKGWSDDQLVAKIEEAKAGLEWDKTTGSAKKWWEAFEKENAHRKALVLRLAEELQNRKATITEFFLAYVYSNTDNIQANLHYLDYTRLKKEEEKKKKEAQAQAKAA